MRSLQMFFQSHPTSLNNFIIKDKVRFDWVESEKVLLAVFGKRFCINARHHVSDVVVLVQNRRNGRFDIFIALDQQQLFLKY